MTENRKLYFIAIIPPDEVEKRIYQLKSWCASNLDSRRALNSPGHITLVPPFWAEEMMISSIVTELKKKIEGFKAFNLNLSNFNYFKPKVIYVNVMISDELKNLYNHLKTYFTKATALDISFREEYHPHTTIAFKDLRKKMFFLGKDHFDQQEFDANFKVDGIFVLMHDKKKWTIQEKLPFNTQA